MNAGPSSTDSDRQHSILHDAAIDALSSLLASNFPQTNQILMELSAPSDAMAGVNLAILTATVPKIQIRPSPKLRSYTSELVDMISAPDLSLALSIVELCTTSEHEGILDLLLHILSASGMATKLLKAVVEQEVGNTGESHIYWHVR